MIYRLVIYTLLFFTTQIGFTQNQDINITGNGVNIFNGGGNSPNISNNTDLGSVELGAIRQSVFSIENTHTGGNPSNNQLNVSNITISGIGSSDFSLSGITLPAVINRNSSTTFIITYSPSCIGESIVSISITSDDPDENPYTFNLRGEGVEVGAGPSLILIETYPLAVLEPSGLTYDKVNNELLTVSDNTAQVYRISTTGNVLQTYGYSGVDTEGVTFFTPNKVLITEERSRDLIEYDYVNNTAIAHNMVYVNDTSGDVNQGIEGVSYDPSGSGTIFFIGEIPAVLVHADNNFNVTNEYLLTYASDISATYFEEETGYLWLASHEESTIYRCNIDGSVVNTFPINDENGNIMAQMEGIAIDYANQFLYAVDDTNEKLYKFSICGLKTDTTPPVVNCKDISIALDGSGTAVITADDINDCSYDFCGGIDSISISQSIFTCTDIGVNTVTLTVTDLSGNIASCDATVTVNGSLNQTTFSGGTWDNGIPSSSSSVRFSSNYDTAIYGNIDACSCEIDNGVQLDVRANNYLKVSGNITVNGTLQIEHQANVVQIDDNAVVTNNGTINVELTTPVLQTRDFMVMGSPMSAETRNGVFTNAFLVLNHDPSNFIPHPGVPAGGTNFADDNGDFWTTYNGNINVGEGYIVRPQSGYTDPANTTFNMTYSQGTLNNGIINRSVTYNGAGPNPDGTPNALANPYASPISATALINDNALINEVYFWEHLTAPSPTIPGYGSINFSMDDISMYNLSGGTAAANDPGTSTEPNGVISTGQGFGIKAFGSGTVTFTNSMRLSSGNNTLRVPTSEMNRIWLNLSNEEFELGSNTLVAFNENATAGIDPGYDSNRLATAISLYSHLEDGSQQFGIQTRERFDESIKIPMGFASQADDLLEYKISIANMQGVEIENSTVYLIDNFTNTITNLTNEDYTFLSGKGTFNNRFTLQFVYESILGTETNLNNSISIYPNPAQETIFVYSVNTSISGMTLMDMRGRKIVQHTNITTNKSSLDLSSLNSGIYFIRINTPLGSITKKVIKE